MKMSESLKTALRAKAAYLQSDGTVPGGKRGLAECVLDRIDGPAAMEVNTLQREHGYPALEKAVIAVL